MNDSEEKKLQKAETEPPPPEENVEDELHADDPPSPLPADEPEGELDSEKSSAFAKGLDLLEDGLKCLGIDSADKEKGLGTKVFTMARDIAKLKREKDPYTEEILHLWPRTLWFAFLWTCLTFILINSWFLDEIEDTLEDEDFGWEEFLDSQEEETGIGLHDFAKEQLGVTMESALESYLVPCVPPDDSDSFSALEQFTSAYCALLDKGKKEKVASDLSEKLGSEIGWFGRWSPMGERVAKYGSAKEIIEDLDKDHGWIKSLEQNQQYKDSERDIRGFQEFLLTKLMDEIQADRRALIRFCGGWIQWVIFFVGFAILVLCVRRRRMVREHHLDDPERICADDDGTMPKILHSCLAAMKDGLSRSSIEDRVTMRIETLKDNAEKKCYSGLFFLIGMLPSLGFIGTLLGIGSALTRTNALFAAQNSSSRQEAINAITYHLGIAFDTTLIALLAAMFVGFFVHKTRVAEFAMIKRFALFAKERILAEKPNPSMREEAKS